LSQPRQKISQSSVNIVNVKGCNLHGRWCRTAPVELAN
jgi:hypothetical protein